ncbi:DNA starvation/stationary phase protection protein [Bradyrhizobium sp. SZCCHNRI1003]|uniref:Dps family protein n=1 Tax=Bradyrhizobium sp. SZCCHNRI1003 TaxID=3057275 RepID=UPI0029163E93|nr:DNA starvation/stationary phase protection protein [Bradyrhizobium sp. SZCCHNRI1003]
MMDLVAAVRLALAETWVFYFKAHSFHWNVRGPLFRQFHQLFGDLYEDLHGAVDTLAERLRALDALAPASLDEIATGSAIAFTPPPAAADMVAQLLAANDVVITALDDANQAAIAGGNDGLANLLQERLDMHAKWGWMLRATLDPDQASGAVA